MSIEEELVKKFSLAGRRGIVTGGSSGLGKEIALTLSKVGAKVFVFSRTGNFKDETPVSDNIFHYKVDIINDVECNNFIQEIGTTGLDFLVNNAGITKREKIESVDKQTWNNIQDVNVNSVFNMCKSAYPYLKRSKDYGRIVNITSMASYLGFNEVTPYTTSKTALLGLTRGLSVEWAKDDILVNSVSPGWVKSDMVNQVIDEERERKILNRMPLHRYGKPEDIANMVLYLLSPASKYITGQDFAVDGGALAYGY